MTEPVEVNKRVNPRWLRQVQPAGVGWILLLFLLLSACASPPTPTPATSPTPSPTIQITQTPAPSATPRPALAVETTLGLGALEAIAWSPDGAWLAIAAASGTRLLPVTPQGIDTSASPQLIEGWATALAWSPDGRLAIGGVEGGVRIWNPRRGEIETALQDRASRVSALAYDGQTVAIARQDSRIWIWTPQSGNLLGPFEAHTRPVQSVLIAAAPGGGQAVYSAAGEEIIFRASLAAAGAVDANPLGPIRLFNSTAEQLALLPAADGISAWVLSAGSDGYLRAWDVQTGFQVDEWSNAGGALISLASQQRGDENLLAAGQRNGRIVLWRQNNATPEASFPAHDGALLSLALHPSLPLLASLGQDGLVRLSDVSTPRNAVILSELGGFAGAISDLKNHPTQPDWLVSSHADGGLRLWNVSAGQSIAAAPAVHALAVQSLSPSMDGSQWLSAGTDGLLALTSLTDSDGQPVFGEPFAFGAAARPYFQAVFTPQGSVLASAAEPALLYWPSPEGDVLRSGIPGGAWPQSLAFSPASDWWAVALNDGELHLYAWLIAQSAPSQTPRMSWINAVPATRLLPGPDGAWLIAGLEDGRLMIYDTSNAGIVAETQAHPRRVSALSLDSTGQWLASASVGGVIQIRSLPELELLAEAQTGQAVFGLAWLPDSSRLVSGGADGRLTVWQFNP